MHRLTFVKIKDIFGNELSLPDERIKHIKEKHPEITIALIKSTLSNPDYIIVSSIDGHIKIYHKKKEKYCIVVVINTHKELIITPYTSDKLKKGDVEWIKN